MSAAVDLVQVRETAKEAYVYGFPMVDGYRVQFDYFEDALNPEFKAPWNHLFNMPRVYTSEDRAIVSPNSDTPYSMIGIDLRAEPMVLTVPSIEAERYYSIQLIDAYTHNFDYIGSRTTGNDAGSFLIAGPRWSGDTPAGVKKVFRSETEFVMGVYRTQLFKPDDLENVKKVQAGYDARPLSAFLGESAPEAAPAVQFMKPLTPDEQKTSLEFFNVLSFVLQFCPIDSSEVDLRQRFAEIGIAPGNRLDVEGLSPETKAAMEAGISDAWAVFAEVKRRFDAKQVTAGDVFGTRDYLKNNYAYRMAAGVIGLYGNSKQEAMYPFYGVDSDGTPLTGAGRYTLRFAPDQLPPVNAFWSLTMYELPESLLVANPLNRYLINSPMLPQLRRDPDGGLTLLLQKDSPGPELEANWLPAPEGPFMAAMRLYWPKDEAVEGRWVAPPLERVE